MMGKVTLEWKDSSRSKRAVSLWCVNVQELLTSEY